MAHPFHIDPRDAQGEKAELNVQMAFRNKMRNCAPHIMLVGIPNSGRRSAWEARQRSKEGLVKGFPDMLAFYDSKVAALEFKSGTGQIKPEQMDVLNRLHQMQFPVGIFRSAETAFDWLQQQWPQAFKVAA